MDTEGGRIANLMNASRRCMAATALARAQALRGSPANCRTCAGTSQSAATATEVPQSSSLLEKRTAACPGYISPYECVPESIRLQRVERRTLDTYAALGPYDRVFPAPCPVIIPSPFIYDASGAVIGFQPLGNNISGNPAFLQGKNCPLPNKPDNPVLPG